MKVSLEGSRTEFEELAELIAFGLEYRSSLRPMSKVPANSTTLDPGRASGLPTSSKSTDRPGFNDVPNRYREEGVQ